MNNLNPVRSALTLSTIAIAALLTACGTLAPDYQRPAAPVAATWSDGSASAPAAAQAQSTADLGWREFFTDEKRRPALQPACRSWVLRRTL